MTKPIVYDVSIIVTSMHRYAVCDVANQEEAVLLCDDAFRGETHDPRVQLLRDETLDCDAFLGVPMIIAAPRILDANARIVWWLMTWLLEAA